ncbi:tegument protein UL24 [Panine betaherpesvirus 2]|uniref:Tegument protein UL24 n=1 Tax=Panine betaherpesvirus 2 TaxID=188763 RepID=Q8QS64_9BETA|nr:tegument protein UL24 [Panine betaherpesvirus 2]AAM00674.2 tegument protein UL24 [Panine betaherpesvirus 2]QXV67776.1 tegument protein UL24 [Panine betaherpesvirus 2]
MEGGRGRYIVRVEDGEQTASESDASTARTTVETVYATVGASGRTPPVEFSDRHMTDLASLALTAEFGLGCLEAYVRINNNHEIPVAWPPGWSLVLQEPEVDEEFKPEDVKAWSYYLCCETRLAFVGRIIGEPVLSPDQQKKTIAFLVSEDGYVFCYVREDDAVYFIARNLMEFARTGLRAVESLHCLRYLGSSLVKRYFRPLRRAWSLGFDAVARFIIRNHGELLPLTYPPGAELRLCNLKCFESCVDGGHLLRAIKESFGSRVIGLGTVNLKGEQTPFPYLRWPPERVPIVISYTGGVYACDIRSEQYIRLGDNLCMFMCLGLNLLFENRRFSGHNGVHDRVPDCPKGRQHH